MTDKRMGDAHWIAVDWGTTHLRIWVLDRNNRVRRQIETDQGMAQLQPTDYEAVLVELLVQDLHPDQPLDVICCGMVGARQAWQEAPYAPCPTAPPNAKHATRVTTRDPRLKVYLLPGIKQASPPDVMRGEETQIAGFIARNTAFDGVLCLPGTHTKWVHISADGWDDEMFTNAIDDAMARPAGVAAQLFALRAQSLIAELPPQAARARLSGLLIGLELAAARPYWLGTQIAVLGDTAVAQAYCKALAAQGTQITMASTELMTLDGLQAAYATLLERTK